MLLINTGYYMALILGIETSCDETGIALYDSQKGIMAHALYSQIALHNQYGGVVPELASRDHVKKIIPLINQCALDANIKLKDIDAIAYTTGPGLNGALLIGASVANGLAFSLNKPVIPIHHLEGHLLSPFLCEDKPSMPFIALLVSGGHSQLIAVKQIGEYTILGDTLDDAAGEAFDKTAKMLNLPYPGGKYIALLAQNGIEEFKLPRPMLHSNDLQFSFSGLKTAVATLIHKLGGVETLTQQTKCNIAKSIEESITDVLVKKSVAALKTTGIYQLVVSGGVSANLQLRHKLGQIPEIKVYYPPLDLCTDNGAMIALAGSMRYHLAKFDYNFSVTPRYPLELIV
jgi:N6-L-threonylcarbamoyladenine synthase